MIDRIDAVDQQLASGPGALTRLLERKSVRRPQPEPTLAAVALEAQPPALAAGGTDLQVEAADMAVTIAAGVLQPLRLLRRQHCPTSA